MAKKLIRENHRIEVTPYVYGSDDHDLKTKRCRDIEKQIRRHIDDWEDVRVEHDSRYACEFCGSTWEVISEEDAGTNSDVEVGQPWCCNKAIEEFYKELEKEQKK